ncbi:Probable serine/threonine-protein kinase drkD [Galdieria sulphuraria]|uniref:Serine/threonine protein kinase n=1 Tax=Galdieria sulphuraria TaxID=130081 RepID=M2W407_GALSU|nr:serine/threonine protein kinase [Galdieria sulphuraria]EME30481.1 serine/threonine protein kinase [Galdieria sulphuraria]GJD06376.1 Probable serine/threonine-protein kinase drkD [Galdieria sulphuraria]|eukprot:XP_005707001.1 serine/threonine protein kinase [Galdieria sulphuraria]
MGADVSKDSTPENVGKKEGEKEHHHILPHHIHVPHVFHKSSEEREQEHREKNLKVQPRTANTPSRVEQRHSSGEERNSRDNRESPKAQSDQLHDVNKGQAETVAKEIRTSLEQQRSKSQIQSKDAVAATLEPEDVRLSASMPADPSEQGPQSPSLSARNESLSNNWLIDYKALRIGEPIGKGSFGTVSEGRYHGTRVAVKTIRRGDQVGDALASEESIEQFKKEAELNCKLRHPNIVLFMGICVEPSFVCIVTEFMERGTVRDLLLSKSRLEWNIRLNWALDTATGMAYLHSLEPCIIHRDLKTTNLLVDRGFNVKICDFGLSRFMSKDSVMSAVGTVQFAAPEVLKHERYTEKADVFSFGTVLWELCSRERVFRGVPQIDVYKRVVAGRMPEIPPECDPRYRAMIEMCWDMSPECRPSFEDLVEMLSDLLTEERSLGRDILASLSVSRKPPLKDEKGLRSGSRLTRSKAMPVIATNPLERIAETPDSGLSPMTEKDMTKERNG